MRKGKTGSASDLLQRLGRGEIELNHEAFHTLQPWRAAAHLRELLMACGILPTIDKQLCLFEGWLTGRLPERHRFFIHPTLADLVLARGRDFAPAPWPSGPHPQRMGDCFAAAHTWANREGWTYCEGYALAVEPIIGAFEHAWCLTPDGRVADPAVPDGWIAAYRGLPLSDTFIRTSDRSDNAVITFGRNLSAGPNTALLRDGLPSGALVAIPADTPDVSPPGGTS